MLYTCPGIYAMRNGKFVVEDSDVYVLYSFFENVTSGRMKAERERERERGENALWLK